MKSFWFQFCLAVANILYHKYLCLASLPETETAAGFEYLKAESADLETFNDLIAYFEKVWMLREGPGNFSIERENFGKQNSVNFNKLLKQQFHLADSRFSLVNLLSLTQDELAKSSIRYQQGNVHIEHSTRQNEFIKKRYDLFAKSESKDVAQFFATLTFKDNNGSVKEMENYIIGDEDEVAEDDDGAYEVMEHERLAQQVNDDKDDYSNSSKGSKRVWFASSVQ